MTWVLLAFGVGALGVMSLGMPAGVWVARRLSAGAFDRLVLVLLVVLALRLIYSALA